MKAFDYIFTKQTLWAARKGITLRGSKAGKGRLAYTPTLDENLFEPIAESVRQDIEKGDGGEFTAKNGTMPKMHAVHSSSALGVNVFQYWLTSNQVAEIASACGFCREGNQCAQTIRFESKFPITNKFKFSPNLDVVIENKPGSQYDLFAIECKFSEAYTSRGHGGIDPKYLDLDVWENLPNLHALAKELSPDDKQNSYLHPAQLIKHILGLKQACGKSRFRLLYLWYDVLGSAGALHREEIDRFTETAKLDGVKFHAMSYQELIKKIAARRQVEHVDYLNYLSGRYL